MVQDAVRLNLQRAGVKLDAVVEIATLQGDGAAMHQAQNRARRLQLVGVPLGGVEKAKVPKDRGTLMACGGPRGIDLDRGVQRPQRRAVLKAARGGPQDHAASAQGGALDRVQFKGPGDGAFANLKPLGIGIQMRSHLRAGLG